MILILHYLKDCKLWGIVVSSLLWEYCRIYIINRSIGDYLGLHVRASFKVLENTGEAWGGLGSRGLAFLWVLAYVEPNQTSIFLILSRGVRFRVLGVGGSTRYFDHCTFSPKRKTLVTQEGVAKTVVWGLGLWGLRCLQTL